MTLSLPEEDLPFEIARLNLQPGDVLAVRPLRPISTEAAARIQAHVRRLLPDTVVFVLDAGFDLTVVDQSAARKLGEAARPAGRGKAP